MEHYLLGGYTKRQNDGIYHITFNTDNATFSTSQKIATVDNPTYLTTSQDGTYCFAVCKTDSLCGVIALKKSDTQWPKVSECLTSQIVGCHITYRENSRTLYVSNYHEGAIDVYLFDENEQLHHLQRITHTGSGPHPNQQSAHVHFAGLDKTGHYLLVCDLGIDQVVIYAIKQDGTLQSHATLSLPGGTGPRHLVWHPTLNIFYVIGELNNTVTTVEWNLSDEPTIIDTLATITDGDATAAGAAIRITSDGQFLYTSTRFVDIITTFAVNLESGLLTPIQYLSTSGNIPRDFVLSENEQYVLIPHQDSDNISVFARDGHTGTLTYLHNDTSAPECVCICPIA